MAVGGDLAWYSEVDSAANTVLKNHYPNIPNIGDVTIADWSTVEPVDVITGGYPCQPFSTAGKRKGEKDDRHLWPYVREAISSLEPRMAIMENVAGHLTLGLGTVLGELSEVGYDAKWGVVRASDAGAPHQRARVFVVAYPQGADWGNPEPYSVVQARPGTSELGERDSADTWGTFSKAILRWEQVIGRSAPQAWQDKIINPRFVEWMMGLPEGWVTGHDLPVPAQLKMLGNGVVPQQARLALRILGV